MLRTLSAGIVGCLVVGLLAACGGSSNSTTGEVRIPKTSASVDKLAQLGLGKPSPELCKGRDYKVGVDYFSTSNAFSLQWLQGVKDAAKATGCVDIFALSDNLDAATALQNAQTFVQKDMEGVLLLQVIAAAQPGIMRTLKDIPVLSSSVPAPGGGIFVSVPDYDSGYDGGEFLAKAFAEKHPDVKPYLIIGTYPDGGEGSMQRLKGVTEGIQSVIPDIPKDQIIEVDTKADPVGTREKALAVISKIPDDAYVVSSAINDDTAFAIFQALKQRGRQDKSFVLGIGGVNPDGLRYVCKYPQFVGTVSHLPDRWGNYLVPAVMAMIRGEEIPPALDIPYKILTRDNMREAYPDAPC